MEAKYNVTGKERKALVTAIENIAHEPAIYQMTPTFEYKVGNFTIVEFNYQEKVLSTNY